ncbi:MAG: hypothetical protein JXL97_08580 [Bacteroidales bacterium]|nr:hypothetical protein [Bacteroidales bacterium]
MKNKIFIILLLFVYSCSSTEYIYFTQWDTGNYLHYIKLNKASDRYERIYGCNNISYKDNGFWQIKNDSIILIPDKIYRFDTIKPLIVEESYDSNLINNIEIKFTFSQTPINEDYLYDICLNLNKKNGHCDTFIQIMYIEELYDNSTDIMTKIIDYNKKISTKTILTNNLNLKNIYISSPNIMSEQYKIKDTNTNSVLIKVNPNLPVLSYCVENNGTYNKDSLVFNYTCIKDPRYDSYALKKKNKRKFIREYNRNKNHNWILGIIGLNVKKYFK